MPESLDQLREKRVELILQQLEGLPALPQIVSRALTLAPNDSAGLIELVRIEPPLADRTLQLLRLAADAKQTETLDLAVGTLGLQYVRDSFLSVALFQT